MITYIRYRTETSTISSFINDLKELKLKLANDTMITGFSFSQCNSENENFIIEVLWNKSLIQKNDVDVMTLKSKLMSFLNKMYHDYILEFRNYAILTGP